MSKSQPLHAFDVPLQPSVTEPLLCALNTYLAVERHPYPITEPILGAWEQMPH